MTAAQQHRALGVSASASEDMVIIQVGNAMRALTPHEVRTFLKCTAREMFRAEMVEVARELDHQKAVAA